MNDNKWDNYSIGLIQHVQPTASSSTSIHTDPITDSIIKCIFMCI